jgi:hypothetical protein
MSKSIKRIRLFDQSEEGPLLCLKSPNHHIDHVFHGCTAICAALELSD